MCDHGIVWSIINHLVMIFMKGHFALIVYLSEACYNNLHNYTLCICACTCVCTCVCISPEAISNYRLWLHFGGVQFPFDDVSKGTFVETSLGIQESIVH